VAFSKLLPENECVELKKVLVRSWTVGDIITAIGSTGLMIRAFEEIPSSANPQFPEFFMLVADKVDVQLTDLLKS